MARKTALGTDDSGGGEGCGVAGADAGAAVAGSVGLAGESCADAGRGASDAMTTATAATERRDEE
jgi:hypothetical protein